MGFSRQEHWSGLPFSSPGDLPDPGIEPGSPALQADTLTSEPPGKSPEKQWLLLKVGGKKKELRCIDLIASVTLISESEMTVFSMWPPLDLFSARMVVVSIFSTE